MSTELRCRLLSLARDNIGKGLRKMYKSKRFQEIYKQGQLSRTNILVDTETGVNYLFHAEGYSVGLTVLLDRDGKPIVTQTECN